MKVSVHQFELPLRHTFTISRESYDVQPTVIVELEDEDMSGYGESTTNRYYGVTIDSLRASIEAVRSLLESASLRTVTPEELWEEVSERIPDDPFAQCAIDQAAHDLWGKLHGQPVYQLWGLTIENVARSCYTIGIDTIDKMVEKMAEMPGWPIYKIKLGTERDVEIVKKLREHTNATLRVDANCGWTLEQAIRNATELADLGVEFVEQPLAARRWEDHRCLYELSLLPIVADESCIRPDDVDRCAGHFHGVNIKLVKCGGLTPARRMIRRAKELDLRVMVGCMTESSVGISAIAQLLPLLDYVDMDGATLLASDVATGVVVERGICQFPARNGCGVILR